MRYQYCSCEIDGDPVRVLSDCIADFYGRIGRGTLTLPLSIRIGLEQKRDATRFTFDIRDNRLDWREFFMWLKPIVEDILSLRPTHQLHWRMMFNAITRDAK